MRTLPILALLLTACDVDEATPSGLATEELPPPHDFGLYVPPWILLGDSPDAIASGLPTTTDLVGLAATRRAGGRLACPRWMGFCSDLHRHVRVLDHQYADDAGNAYFSLQIPGSIASGPIAFQAGYVDGFGVAHTSTPAFSDLLEPLGDEDGDGLYSIDEVSVYGTDPTVADTDGGGEDDGSEILASRDPTDPADDVGLIPDPCGPPTIDPYVPYGDTGFQSVPGTGYQVTITVTLPCPASRFDATIIDPDYPGNEMIAYDINGVEIGRVSFIGDGTPGVMTTDSQSIIADGITTVLLVPDPFDYMAYEVVVYYGSPGS